MNPLEPITLEITDQSHKHIGHAGWQEGGQSHFHIYIVSNYFLGKSKLERHKIIHELLEDEFNSTHSISFKAKAPNEIKSVLK